MASWILGISGLEMPSEKRYWGQGHHTGLQDLICMIIYVASVCGVHAV